MEKTKNIILFGGGRWARVIIEELCKLSKFKIKILVYSPRNSEKMMGWISDNKINSCVSVLADLPEIIDKENFAVIVANAVQDHERSVEWALKQKVSVMVEKPIALNYKASLNLKKLSEDNQIYFAAGHVFLFAEYLYNFAKCIKNNNNQITSIKLKWADAKYEVRYGEVKVYDPGVPIHLDVMPHIISILSTLIDDMNFVIEDLKVFRGGAHLDLKILINSIPCQLTMIRNGSNRIRCLDVETINGINTLSFENEPGVISYNEEFRSGDPAWNMRSKPLSTMLKSFIEGAFSQRYDKKLDVKFGIEVSSIIDKVNYEYNKKISKLIDQYCSGNADKDDLEGLHYALNEIIYSSSRQNPEIIVDEINQEIFDEARVCAAKEIKYQISKLSQTQ